MKLSKQRLFFYKNNNLNSYAELFRKCVKIDSSQHNCFNNKKKDELFLIHFNIRSLQKLIDELNTYLVSFKNQQEIIAISETKLRAGAINRNIHLEGYKLIHSDSKTSAGGVALYIKDTFTFSINECSQRKLRNVEHLWVDIQTKRGSLVVGVIYRHPDDSGPGIDKFNEEINDLFLTLNKNKYTFILCW